MLSFVGTSTRLCDQVSRREILRVGGLGLCGLSLPKLLEARETAAASQAKAKSCIILFLMGGPPQHSTWDPKPYAPREVQGDFGEIATNVPGIHIGELMPRCASIADKLAILRAVSTGDNAHSSSGYYMLTGRPHQPKNFENANPGAPNHWPTLAATVGQLWPGPAGILPATVRLPHHIFNTDGSVWPGQDAGFLGRRADPWLLKCHPGSPDFSVPEFVLPVDVDPDRFTARRNLLASLNRHMDELDGLVNLSGTGGHTRRAFDILTSPNAQSALRLDQELGATRDGYGRSQFGQSVLLARRLVEAGVSLVQVNWFRGPDEPPDNPCWDSHTDETKRLKEVLVPPTDQAISALVRDLDERGRLEETLIVVMAEFGRTPRFNARAGRDHWGNVFSIALAGGGIQGGVVHGVSDRLGGEPLSDRVGPEDIQATVLHCLGITPSAELRDPLGRPFPASTGNVIRKILA